jgi:hypothetical protein
MALPLDSCNTPTSARGSRKGVAPQTALLLAGTALALGLQWITPALAFGSGPFLVEVAEGVRLELPSGEVVSLATQPGDRLSAVSSLSSGWVAAGDRAAGGHRELLLFAAGPGGLAQELAVPSHLGEASRREPVLFVSEGALGGLAWIEGDSPSTSAVQVASLQEEDWQEPITLSPPGPGSQLALAAAVLDDGSWLLLWSAYDGEDDEVLWSLRRDGSWSEPAPLAPGNRVPDVAPVVTAVEGGALAAWSRFERGRYRTVVSFFNGQGWGVARALEASRGVLPTLERGPGGALLLARTTRPRGWEALELDATGRALRRAEVAAGSSLRPRLSPGPESRVTFHLRGEAPLRHVPWEVVP